MEHLSISATLVKQQAKRAATSPTLRTITGVAGGNSFAMVIGFVGSLVQARFVMPEDLGYFRSFAIITGYVFFLQLGIFDGLMRFYPYYVGKGKRERALAIAETAQTWIVMVTVLVVSVYMALAIWTLITGNWRASLAWLVQVVAITSFFYGGYLGVTYRARHDFNTVTRGTVLSSVVNLFTLPVFFIAPYVALSLRSSAGSLANLLFLHRKRPLHLQLRFNARRWLDLVKVSLPMFTAGYGASTGWSVVETTLILRFLGTESLGLWSMSFLLLAATNKVAQAITAIYTPRIIETFGHTESVRASLSLCRKPLLYGTPAMVLMAGAGALLLPFIVPVLMPHYVDAIPIMKLMLIMLPLIILHLPYAILIAMGKIAQQNVVTFIGLGSFVILAMVAVQFDLGLIGIVGASLIGRVVSLVLSYGMLYVARRHETASGVI